MTTFTYEKLAKPAITSFKNFETLTGQVKDLTAEKRQEMLKTFAMFAVASYHLAKSETANFRDFVAMFYLEERPNNVMSKERAKHCRAFGNKASGNSTDKVHNAHVGFENEALYVVGASGKLSKATIDLWIAEFKEAGLATWRDCAGYGVKVKEVKLSDTFKAIHSEAVAKLKANTNHSDTVDTFKEDLEAILKKAQKNDDTLDDKADKEREKEEEKQEIDLEKIAHS